MVRLGTLIPVPVSYSVEASPLAHLGGVLGAGCVRRVINAATSLTRLEGSKADPTVYTDK